MVRTFIPAIAFLALAVAPQAQARQPVNGPIPSGLLLEWEVALPNNVTSIWRETAQGTWEVRHSTGPAVLGNGRTTARDGNMVTVVDSRGGVMEFFPSGIMTYQPIMGQKFKSQGTLFVR